MSMTRTPKRWVAWAVGAVLLVSSGLVMGRTGANPYVPIFPLDSYPGFGRTPEAVARDDVIAYWEAFQREQHIRACMHDEGFDYAPSVAFPDDPMRAVATTLGATAAPATRTRLAPDGANRQYRDALPAGELDRYTQALYGETAEDFLASEASGQVPANRGEEFATGGCTGAARDAVPSIWDAPRRLSEELAAMGREIMDSDDLDLTRQGYQACAEQAGGIKVTSPRDLDELLAQEGEGAPTQVAEVVADVYEQCSADWEAGYRHVAKAHAEQFVERHRDELASIAQRYEGILDTIASDDALHGYLAQELARP